MFCISQLSGNAFWFITALEYVVLLCGDFIIIVFYNSSEVWDGLGQGLSEFVCFSLFNVLVLLFSPILTIYCPLWLLVFWFIALLAPCSSWTLQCGFV